MQTVKHEIRVAEKQTFVNEIDVRRTALMTLFLNNNLSLNASKQGARCESNVASPIRHFGKSRSSH